MQINRPIKNKLLTLALVSLFAISFTRLNAQICANAATQVYGLTMNGGIYPITVSTAAVGAQINPPPTGNSPSQSNGMGYNSLNGKFYYFKRNADMAPQEFVSFDPATNIVSILASCPTTNAIHAACATANGLGFYALDINANFYYYKVATNTWTLITSTFVNQSNTNINGIITTQSGGDMAIDGYGNLWMLTSSSSNYALYKVSAPPTTAVASITATQVVAPSSNTPTNNGFAGIAFNQTGQIILSTYGDDKLYRLENNLSLTFLGNLGVSGVGTDLTSCNFPMLILPVTMQHFSASLKDNHNVLLNWTLTQQANNKNFYIENSQNGTDWTEIGSVQNTSFSDNSGSYSFMAVNPVNGNQYYRIRMTDISGKVTYSEIKMISVKNNNKVSVWPNPSSNYIRIQNENPAPGRSLNARLFDLSGRMVNETILHGGVNTVNISSLPIGTYVVKIQLANGDTYNQKLVKN